MLSIFDFLKQKIDEQGPLTVSEYMRYRLYSPQIGYYFNAAQNVLFGHTGDFVTAPEISPLFGEMIAVWVLERWLNLGKPFFGLVEWGPGRGLLMADILRTFQVMPEIFTKMNVHLIETSPYLTQHQQQLLQPFQECSIQWHNTEETIPWQYPVIGLGNEFLDAFPIDQWIYTEKGWVIRTITYHQDHLQWEKGNLTGLPDFVEILQPLTLEMIVEVSEEAYRFIQKISRCLTKGYFLFIDYGSFSNWNGDTLQGVHRHKLVPVLQTSNVFDLTAHVNFAMLNKIALENGLILKRQSSQAAFLQDLGILDRAVALRKKSGFVDSIDQQLYRLLNSSQMGSLFKVIEWAKES